MIRQRQKRGIFQSGVGGCLLTITSASASADGDKVMFDSDYADRHGFTHPVLFVDVAPEQLGLKVPPPDADTGQPFTFADVAKLVGPYRPIQVIDTATQLTTTYTLQEYVDYLETRRKDRTRTLNVITLEFSQTPLTELVTEPQFARDVDFVHCHWPKTLVEVTKAATGTGEGAGGRGVNAPASAAEAAEIMEQMEELADARPKVSKYCLMTAAGSWTDFHVDFGGTAVWYHLFRGTKIFYFIEPTPENLKIYSEWATSTSSGAGSKQAGGKAKAPKKSAFLPDLIHAAGGSIYEVVIQQGQTLLIPSGWIHAVYTPHDSLVFGGNYIHRHSLEMQLTIYRLEKQMKVGKEYRFPNYQRLLWYVGRDFLEDCEKYTKSVTCLPTSAEVEGQADDLTLTDMKVKTSQRRAEKLCAKYPVHILRGYCALAKELQRWAGSKNKQNAEQYPPGVDVVDVAKQLGLIMDECMSYLDNKIRDKERKERNLQEREKKKEERALAKAQAEAKRIERQAQIQARKEEAERKRAEREMKKAAKLEERRKGLESEYEEVAWAQCDRCDEWREMPTESAAARRARMELLKAEGNGNGGEHPFFCSEVGEICIDNGTMATAWKQCESCMSWHAVPKEVNNNDKDDTDGERADGQERDDANIAGAPKLDVVPVGGDDGGAQLFTCEFIGKKCSPKKFKRAKIALSG